MAQPYIHIYIIGTVIIKAVPIAYWFKEFKRSRIYVFNEESEQLRWLQTTDVMVNRIHDIVLADFRVKIREIANIVNIWIKCVQNSFHEKLNMRKL